MCRREDILVHLAKAFRKNKSGNACQSLKDIVGYCTQAIGKCQYLTVVIVKRVLAEGFKVFRPYDFLCLAQTEAIRRDAGDFSGKFKTVKLAVVIEGALTEVGDTCRYPYFLEGPSGAFKGEISDCLKSFVQFKTLKV